MDFEDFLNRVSLTNRDFVFLDPPYFCEFSEYDKNSFSKEDHRRLANYLSHTPAKFIMIIKSDKFIRGLYGKIISMNIASFDKIYLFNVRGRNNRDARHLIISNF